MEVQVQIQFMSSTHTGLSLRIEDFLSQKLDRFWIQTRSGRFEQELGCAALEARGCETPGPDPLRGPGPSRAAPGASRSPGGSGSRAGRKPRGSAALRGGGRGGRGRCRSPGAAPGAGPQVAPSAHAPPPRAAPARPAWQRRRARPSRRRVRGSAGRAGARGEVPCGTRRRSLAPAGLPRPRAATAASQPRRR